MAACSGKRHQEQPPPSGSNHAITADAGTESGKSRWQLMGFADAAETHRYAILKNGSRLRLVSADGSTLAEFTPADMEHVVSVSVPGTFIWVDLDTIHAVEMPSGHERWTRTIHGRRVVVTMDDAVALTDVGIKPGGADTPESLVLDIRTGRVRYRSETRATMISGDRVQHAFVFFGEAAVWMVDGGGKALWTTNVPGLDGAADDYFDGSILIVRPDRTYAKIDLASGRLNEGKCTEAELAAKSCLGRPQGAESRFSLGKYQLKHGVVAYAALGVWPHGRTLAARDPVGKIIWKTPLGGCADARNRHGLPDHAFPTDDVVALLVSCAESPSEQVLVVGQSDGHIRYRHAFDHVGRLVSVGDRCVLVLEGVKTALNCLDLQSGKPLWSVPVFGATESGATAFPLEGGNALLVDSNPLTVSRVGADGKRIWQTELPETELSLGDDSDHGVGRLIDKATRREWSWSQGMGVLAPARDGEEANISVLDLANGKLHEIQ